MHARQLSQGPSHSAHGNLHCLTHVGISPASTRVKPEKHSLHQPWSHCEQPISHLLQVFPKRQKPGAHPRHLVGFQGSQQPVQLETHRKHLPSAVRECPFSHMVQTDKSSSEHWVQPLPQVSLAFLHSVPTSTSPYLQVEHFVLSSASQVKQFLLHFSHLPAFHWCSSPQVRHEESSVQLVQPFWHRRQFPSSRKYLLSHSRQVEGSVVSHSLQSLAHLTGLPSMTTTPSGQEVQTVLLVQVAHSVAHLMHIPSSLMQKPSLQLEQIAADPSVSIMHWSQPGPQCKQRPPTGEYPPKHSVHATISLPTSHYLQQAGHFTQKLSSKVNPFMQLLHIEGSEIQHSIQPVYVHLKQAPSLGTTEKGALHVRQREGVSGSQVLQGSSHSLQDPSEYQSSSTQFIQVQGSLGAHLEH